MNSVWCKALFLRLYDIILFMIIDDATYVLNLQANPESIYAQALQNKLFPNHTYSYVSGGDPLSILDLSVNILF